MKTFIPSSHEALLKHFCILTCNKNEKKIQFLLESYIIYANILN